LLAVFDRGPVCCLDIPGVTGVMTCLMPLVSSCGSRDVHARRVRERLKSFRSDVVIHFRQRIEWKEEKWKVRGSSKLSLLFVLSVVVYCVSCLHCVVRGVILKL